MTRMVLGRLWKRFYTFSLFSSQGTSPEISDRSQIISGDYSEEVTPVPIPNTEVKLLSADDTWWATARESRSLPVYLLSNR